MTTDYRERTRALLEAARRVPIEQLLERGGVAHHRGQGWPCPVCGEAKRSNGCGIVRSDACRWHCFACGEGGTALDLWLRWRDLDPGRLDRAAMDAVEELVGAESAISVPRVQAAPERPLLTRAQIGAYWRLYSDADGGSKTSRQWLESRGLPVSLQREIGSIEYPGCMPRKDLRDALPAVVLPLRSTHPDRRGEVVNLVIRGSSGAKAVTLNVGAGTTRDDGWPLCYGDPVAAMTAETVMVVEGGPDWLTGMAVWPDRAVVGGFCADDFVLWPQWLEQIPGRLVFVPHLDALQWRCLACRGGWRKVTRLALAGGLCPSCGGAVEKRRPGISAMQACMSQLGRGEWFPWRSELERLGIGLDRFMSYGSTDLNDLIRPEPDGWGVPTSAF